MFILIIQSTYDRVEIAIYNNNNQIENKYIAKQEASSKILHAIESLLTEYKIGLKDINKIIVNLGPSPFTTLRTVISTVNGLAFANQIPLIGVDGLHAFVNHDLNEFINHPLLVILNAFSNDVYYAIKDKSLESGVMPIDNLLEKISQFKNFYVAGNGYQQYKDKFINCDITIIDKNYPSLNALYKESINKKSQSQVLPLYLKTIKIY
jgi:tRNA threonylcarbamoyladenosine biosynthesis protein TsaB